MKDTYDLNDDAPRYVIEALMAVDRPLSSYDLADNYDPPKPNNMADIKSGMRDGFHDGQITNLEAKEHLMTEAVSVINYWNRDHVHDDIRLDEVILDEERRDNYELADGVDVNALVGRDGQPLIRKSVLGDPFNPETGMFANNIRTPNPEGYGGLRESMEEFGYLPGHPVVKDENGVTIAGHRRETVAAELGLTPDVLVHRFGFGDGADAQRLKVALGSNTGFEPISQADRQKIALFLYQSKGWKMARVAEALNVTAMTISRDLRNLTDVKSDQPKRGRPRKNPKPINEPKPEPAPEPEPVEEPKPEPPGGLTEISPGQTDRVKQALEKTPRAPSQSRTRTTTTTATGRTTTPSITSRCSDLSSTSCWPKLSTTSTGWLTSSRRWTSTPTSRCTTHTPAPSIPSSVLRGHWMRH